MTQSDQTNIPVSTSTPHETRIQLERLQPWAEVERSPSGYIMLWVVTHEGRRGYVTMAEHQARELAMALTQAIEAR